LTVTAGRTPDLATREQVVSAISKIYNLSGRPLRIVGVNAYGVRNRFRLREWERILDQLERTERLKRDDQVRLVRERLKVIISFAIKNVPFYGKFSSLLAGIDNADVFDILAKLPPVGKEDINREPEAFLSSARGRHVISRTSGTTGTPFYVHMDRHTFVLGDALWWRRTRWAGYEKADWIARLVGDPIIPLRIKNPEKPWIISHLDRRIYFSTFHLSKHTAVRIGELLKRRKPSFIMGYPSSLEILCSYLEESGFESGWKPKNILFSSEPMYAHQEKIVRRVFQSDIRGIYGSAEKVISAAQCERGTYHLSIVDGYLEGQFGIMENRQPGLVTTLTNRVMPLIRYRIGDVISAEPSLVCKCGRTLPAISPVITKQEDWVITPSGRKISPSAITWAFKHLSGIRKAQLVQDEIASIKVYVDADEANFLEYRTVLKESLREFFFGEMDVEIIKTDRIDVMQSGKSRFVVNKLRRGFPDAATDPESQNG
jgi:phenylacetate-CoA ligase